MKKTVLITGASSGFGKSCAHLFAQNGWQLILLARREERLKSLQKELSRTTHVHTLKLDVRHCDGVFSEMGNLLKTYSPIDVLINNAGLALGLDPASSADLNDWEIMVDTNIKGLLYFTRALLPDMVAHHKGHIINIGSVAGTYPYPGGNVYGATKAFVKQFSRNLRADLLGTGIRVTNIEPGLAESEFSIVRFKGDTEKAAQSYKNTDPLTPEDIAEIIFWVSTLPPHININSLEVMPTHQAWGHLAVHRKT